MGSQRVGYNWATSLSPKTGSKLPRLLSARCAFDSFSLFCGPLTGLTQTAEYHSALCVLPYNHLSFQQSFNTWPILNTQIFFFLFHQPAFSFAIALWKVGSIPVQSRTDYFGWTFMIVDNYISYLLLYKTTTGLASQTADIYYFTVSWGLRSRHDFIGFSAQGRTRLQSNVNQTLFLPEAWGSVLGPHGCWSVSCGCSIVAPIFLLAVSQGPLWALGSHLQFPAVWPSHFQATRRVSCSSLQRWSLT